MEAVLDNTYMWSVLNGLSLRDKMEVISRLSSSVAEALTLKVSKPKAVNPLSASFGAWHDETKYSTEDLVNDINVMACDNDDFINGLMK